jgi:hypothetical protein
MNATFLSVAQQAPHVAQHSVLPVCSGHTKALFVAWDGISTVSVAQYRWSAFEFLMAKRMPKRARTSAIFLAMGSFSSFRAV